MATLSVDVDDQLLTDLAAAVRATYPATAGMADADAAVAYFATTATNLLVARAGDQAVDAVQTARAQAQADAAARANGKIRKTPPVRDPNAPKGGA